MTSELFSERLSSLTIIEDVHEFIANVSSLKIPEYDSSFFPDGFFIEAGGYDFEDQSTSLYFELKYNWTVSLFYINN